LAYGQDYFTSRRYKFKQQLLERHVLEVLRWATEKLQVNLLSGAGKRALDVGCACGYTTHVLEGLGYDVVGVDISAWGTKQAKTHCGGEFLVCDAQTQMPFSGGFDLVTCFDVLEHLPNPENALAGMFAVCRGGMVCTTPNKKVEKLVRTLTGDYDETHISVKSPEEWRRLFNGVLDVNCLEVECFYDLPLHLGGNLFFRSFNIPTYGLTVRLAAKR